MHRSALVGLVALLASPAVFADDEKCLLVSKIGIAHDAAFEMRLELMSRPPIERLRVVLPSSALERLHSSVVRARREHEKKSGEQATASDRAMQFRDDEFDAKTPEHFANTIEAEISDGETILTFSHVRQSKDRAMKARKAGCAILVPDKMATLDAALFAAMQRHKELLDARRPLTR